MKNLKGEFSVNQYIDEGKFYPIMSYDEVREAFNGIGPEFFPPRIRELLDLCFMVFRDAVIIHDCDYQRGLTKEDKIEADLRFLKNMRLCVWHKHSIWQIAKMLRFFGYAKILYLFVRDFGDRAFFEGKLK